MAISASVTLGGGQARVIPQEMTRGPASASRGSRLRGARILVRCSASARGPLATISPLPPRCTRQGPTPPAHRTFGQAGDPLCAGGEKRPRPRHGSPPRRGAWCRWSPRSRAQGPCHRRRRGRIVRDWLSLRPRGGRATGSGAPPASSSMTWCARLWRRRRCTTPSRGGSGSATTGRWSTCSLTRSGCCRPPIRVAVPRTSPAGRRCSTCAWRPRWPASGPTSGCSQTRASRCF